MGDVFIAMWTRVDDFKPEEGPLRAFLLALTYQLAAEDPGKDGSIRCHTLEGGAGLHFKETLGVLPADEREPIELACFAGSTYGDVAMLLGQTEAKVKRRIRTGLKRMSSAE